MGVGLGYYFFEQIFLGIFINLFDWFQNVADFLLVYNIGVFMSGGDVLSISESGTDRDPRRLLL